MRNNLSRFHDHDIYHDDDDRHHDALEMVEQNHGHHHVGLDDEYNDYDDDHVMAAVPKPLYIRTRQNTIWRICFTCIILIGMIGMVGIGTYVIIFYQINMKNKLHIDEGNSNITNANDNSNEDKHHNNAEGKPSSEFDVLWLNSTVTLEDGPKFEIIKEMKHDEKSFTEGLTYHNGILYESIGLNGKSALLVLDADTGNTVESYPIARKYFGEGLTYMKNNRLVQLTWQSRIGFIYDINDLANPTNFTFTTTRNEGWGITFDATADELIVSDGSRYLHFWNPADMSEKRKVEVVRQNNKYTHNINELEYYKGRVLANIWYEDVIIVINPDTGIVEKEYDMKTLWPENERLGVGADVLNGISVSEDPDILYVTGKNWNRMYQLKLLY